MIPIWKAVIVLSGCMAIGYMIGVLHQSAVIDRIVDDLAHNKRILVKMPGLEFFIKKTKRLI